MPAWSKGAVSGYDAKRSPGGFQDFAIAAGVIFVLHCDADAEAAAHLTQALGQLGAIAHPLPTAGFLEFGAGATNVEAHGAQSLSTR